MSEAPEDQILEPDDYRPKLAAPPADGGFEAHAEKPLDDWPPLAPVLAPEGFSGAPGLPAPPPGYEPPMFGNLYRAEIAPQPRIPHLGHVALLGALALLGLVCTSLLVRAAVMAHLFGVTTYKQAVNDIHYTLGSMASIYLLTLLAAIIVFPLFWRQSFFRGVQWRGLTAIRLRKRLFVAAFVCFLLAMVNSWLMPGPSDTPIDKMFRTPSAAWLMFAFGISFAPFFEEVAFRGFLLPATCTALDWLREKTHDEPAPNLDINGHPEWSMLSRIAASVLVSIPFALMHAEQTAYSLGPFLLLVCVSLVLCWVRLSTRSLAASVLVHSCYNFLLFSLMLLGTAGFRHLDRM